MIKREKGKYLVESKGMSKREGSYTFDQRSSQLSAEPGGSIGVFHYGATATKPLPVNAATGVKSLQCISIKDSEIIKEIQNPANDGAYFVLPSQFNGAEYPGETYIVENITDYKYDMTGGPRGQLAVHPSAGQFLLDNAANSRQPEGINAVSEMLALLNASSLPFKLQNGYLVVPPLDGKQGSQAVEIIKNNLHTVRTLCMEGVPTTGLTPDYRDFSDKTHRVSLVYASAVPVQAYMNLGGPEQERLQLQVAEALSTAQYYGALKKAAARRANTKVYLMALGGGVFNNPWGLIAKAMSVAVEMLDKDDLAVLDIQALTWEGNPDEQSQLSNFLRSNGKFCAPGMQPARRNNLCSCACSIQ